MIFAWFLFVLAERVITKEKKNLLSASFDQETSYEVSQKTDRSVQQENYKKGRHIHRRERGKRNRSQRLKLESLFDKHSNQSLGKIQLLILIYYLPL